MDNMMRTAKDIKSNGRVDISLGQLDTAVLGDSGSSWFFSAPEEFDVSKFSDGGRHGSWNPIDSFSSALDKPTADKAAAADPAEKSLGLVGDNGVSISDRVPDVGSAPVSHFDPTAYTGTSNSIINNKSMCSTTSAHVEPDTGAGTDDHDFRSPSFDHDDISFSGLIDEQGQPTVDLQSVLKRSVLGGYSKASVHDLIDEISNSDIQLRAGLERQIQDLSREVASSTSECKLLRSQMEQIEEHRVNLEASLSDVSAQLGAAHDQSADKAEQLAVVRSQLEQAMDMKGKLEQGIAELEAHKHAATVQIDELKDELNRVSDELVRASKERDSALGRLELMSADMSKNTSMLEDAQNKNSKLEQQIKVLTNELSGAREQVAGHEELINKVEQSVHECTELSNHIAELSQTNAVLTAQNNELAGMCQDFEAERAALLSRVIAAESAVTQAQDKTAAAQAESVRAQKEAAASQQIAAEHETAYKAIRQRCNELTAMLDTAKQRYEALLVELTKTRSDSEKHIKALSESQSMNNHLSNVFAKSCKIISTLMDEFDAVRVYTNRTLVTTGTAASLSEKNATGINATKMSHQVPDVFTSDACGAALNSDPMIANSASKHLCNLDGASTQTVVEHADPSFLTLMDEKNDELATHKLSTDEYLHRRNLQH